MSSISDIPKFPEPYQQVYVIDDDLEVRSSLNFLLLTAGFASRTFSSATDFLDCLPKLRLAPIIVDIRMPIMDGIELMETLLARAIRWPVIAMTGQINEPVASQAMDLGACKLLEKPFNFETLEASLNVAFAQIPK